ncbi:MAG TPA: response regulator [Polyangiaceae bacterium LLY-WYZ-15_(1-7)]|nr:hypothetical protein [Sandaracinus sp.]MBJ70149.1 hypothetical protein [Sandaracinus sp.]HJL06686.1 response regulator [Polyangiaceae bacterium LLY-WYZ-15_(1-7)]HJL13407.1 response regulator [Polyangiaceae bacterium LLY-WYZ-15_(1-7)]HJL22575.1 response regulator [Polyangiaceae bacterium LLY-WYZ-15_(1-7)]
MASKHGTALGVARARFVDGLPRKAKELRGAIALLTASPGAERPREELRRRLHALYASAQVFRLEPLAAALKENIQRLDEVRDAGGTLTQGDLDQLAHLASTLPALGSDEEAGPRPSTGPIAPPPGDDAPRASAPGEPRPVRPRKVSSYLPPAPGADAPRKKATLPGLADEEGQGEQRPLRRKALARIKPVKRTLQGVPPSEAPPASGEAADIPADIPAIPGAPKTPSATGPEAAAPEPTAPAPEPTRARPERRSSRPPRRQKGSFTAARLDGGKPTTLPGEPLEMVVSVLVVDDVESQAHVREALPAERYEMLAASDPEEALRLARSSAPDVVLADQGVALEAGTDLIARLRSDPLTDFVPVVLLHAEDVEVPKDVREHGADAVMRKPATPQALQRTVDRLAGVGEEPWPAEDVVGEATIEEVADRLAREIHRGIVESVAAGRELKVDLGDGSDILAAAWATIARVRAELAQRSGGQVRFRDGAQRGGPAFMSLVDEALGGDALAEEVSLAGRRVIVADDDPAVVWFFAGLLREEGALVVEVEDGAEALARARRQRPDVVISDILMPRMDGLALCRELKRDPALAEVPVILLSWKEDFLQRMRELRAGASGYLRKEAQSGQILARVREVLRPRARLESQLRAGGDVRGRVEAVGLLALLRAVAELRGDARVTVRDAWNLFEVDLRGGELVDVTRTGTDGAFARGERVLPQLLGVTAGRYTVTQAEGALRASLSHGTEALEDAVQKLGAFVDAVSGKHLAKVERVRFDDGLLAAFERASPGETGALVDRIAKGESPREMLMSGEVAPQALELALVDMARRGAVTQVRGVGGADLVAEAYEERGQAREQDLDWLESEESTADIVAAASEAAAAGAAAAEAAAETAAAETAAGAAEASTEPEEPDPEPEPEPEELLHAPTNPPPAPPGLDEEPEKVAAAPETAGEKAAAKKPAKERADGKAASKEPAPKAPKPVEEKAAPKAEPAAPRPAAEAEPGGLGFAGWLVLLVVFGVVGYFGWRAFRTPAPPVEGPAPEAESAAPDAGAASAAAEAAEGAEEVEEAVPENALSFGEALPRIVDAGVAVGEAEGLLLVQESPTGVPTEVAVRAEDEEDERELGPAPVGAPLAEGQYELVFRQGDAERFRYVFVRAGETRVVQPR